MLEQGAREQRTGLGGAEARERESAPRAEGVRERGRLETHERVLFHPHTMNGQRARPYFGVHACALIGG